ncbi:MAG: PASTA domain-containing protein [Candidatus Bacteroides intestinipullorum]|uniref:PASTA domain-containing protein n=1 Tax=Candidatus Bacteroides intestinipullorum TaxID=2838471 RepID=A0A9E2KG06_9BACE|nr:PASTA domain-containing protein [Candidatus Bacteroides intestinipullorum]
MTIKEFFSFRTNRFFWLNILAMPVVLIILVFVTLRWLDAYTRHGEGVMVPDVKHKPVAEALSILEAQDLQGQVADSTYVKTLPPGCVLEYNPPMNQKVKKGRIIYLTVNTQNVPLMDLPDVADNSSLREAEARLLAAGFKLMPNDTVPGEKDWVYGVKMGGRVLGQQEKVPQGAYLTIVVGDGRSHTEIQVDTLGVDSLGLHQEVEETGAADESWF